MRRGKRVTYEEKRLQVCSALDGIKLTARGLGMKATANKIGDLVYRIHRDQYRKKDEDVKPAKQRKSPWAGTRAKTWAVSQEQRMVPKAEEAQ
jgi:hypothetical protein